MKIGIDNPNFHGYYRRMPIIPRTAYLRRLDTAVGRSPVTAILGPRQSGKTTLARQFVKDKQATIFDLESQIDRRRLENPEMVLGDLQDTVVLDEIQALPELFAVLRVLVDRPDNPARFLILGSASPDIVKNVSETLAGRIEFVILTGFDIFETGVSNWHRCWVRGGLPRSFLARNDDDSLSWRLGFIQTFLTRDIPQLGINVPSTTMQRFWNMLAHYHGRTWNASEIARAMGLNHKTVRSYLDVLTGTFMIRQLQPWYSNLAKRQVKSPKIYLRDSGLLHALLNLPDEFSLLGHPAVGASWEGFALEQTLSAIRPPQAYFWSTHQGAEMDLYVTNRGRNYGVEFKFNEAPRVTKSMHVCLNDLNLEHLWVVCPGPHAYPVHERISVLPLERIADIRQAVGT